MSFDHLSTHLFDITFECNLCDRFLRSKSKLIRHIEGHAGEKPFRCELCSKEFTQKISIKKHGKLHKDVDAKRHACKICHRRFKTKNYLVEHVKAHSGIRLRRCKVCGESFAYPSRFKSHIKVLHQENQRPPKQSLCKIGLELR